MRIIIIGAGGHGRVVLDAIRSGRQCEPVGFVDSAASGVMDGLHILGTPADLSAIAHERNILGAIVAVGDNRSRRNLCDMAQAAGLMLVTVRHPTCHTSSTAAIAPGCFVAAGAIVCAHARIGTGAIINTGSIVDHESAIGDYTHVCPGARLAGRVTVGDGAFVGIGATIIQGVAVGAGAIVGAGAVVIRDVEPGVTVAGCPARPLT